MTKQINHTELKAVLNHCYNKKLPLYIWGTFGIGKSQVVKQFCSDNKLRILDIRVSQLEPSDLRGLPRYTNDFTQWCPPDWLPKGGEGILFLDELNLAPPSIQSACYELILDRKIGAYNLPDGWVVFCAGNKEDDNGNIFEVATPLLNRFVHIELNKPDITSWSEWGVQHKVDSRIIAFLNFKPDYLHKWDRESTDKAIPTPRSWEFCSRLMQDAKTDNELNILCASAIGEAGALELLAYIKLTQAINLQEVLENPVIVESIKKIEIKYSIVTGITELYAQDRKLLQQAFNVAVHLEPEFSVLLVRLIKKVDEEYYTANIKKLKGFNHWADQHIKYWI